jgi:ribosomal protein S21
VSACARENLAAAHRESVVVRKPFDEAELLREVRRLMPYESPQVKCARKTAAMR